MSDERPRRGRIDPAAWAQISDEERAEAEAAARQRAAETDRPLTYREGPSGSGEPDEFEEFAPGSEPPPENDFMNLIFALSAAFGALGAGGLTLIPVSAFYFPLGAGAAGLVLFIIGLTMHGRTPWYAWLAGGLGLGSLILGLAAYSDYHQLNDQIQQLQDQLQRFQ